jgi:hypothetical protein
MSFIVADLSIELIEKLRPLVPRIRARDKSLADQIQRAASSVALNIGEAAYSDPVTGARGFTLRPAALARRWRGCASRSLGASLRGQTAMPPRRCSIAFCQYFGS